jgi:S1-C subfamily serine protease
MTRRRPSGIVVRVKNTSAGRWGTRRILIVVPLALAGFALLSGWGGGSRALPAGLPAARYAAVVRTVSPQVLEVRTSRARGSGIVYDRRGDVVTNAHIVGKARKAIVTAPDGRTFQATVVGASPATDLAVVRASGVTLRPARFADSSRVQVGDLALGVGHPFGPCSLPTRVLAIPSLPTVAPDGADTLNSVILTSEAIDRGNSGGALVNVSGQVIGLPTPGSVYPRLGNAAANGIGFAVSSNTMRAVADELIAKERRAR